MTWKLAWSFVAFAIGCGRWNFEPPPDGPVTPRSWTAQPSNTVSKLFQVWGESADDIYAVGESGILHSAGTGIWTNETTVAASYYGVWGTGAGEVYAVGNLNAGEAVIVHLASGAATRQPSGVARPLSSVWGSSASDLYVVGYDGVILHSRVTAYGLRKPPA